jgi:ribosomal protein L13E
MLTWNLPLQTTLLLAKRTFQIRPVLVIRINHQQALLLAKGTIILHPHPMRTMKMNHPKEMTVSQVSNVLRQTNHLVNHKFDSGRRSDRLKELSEAGKHISATSAMGKTVSRRRRRRGGQSDQAGPSQQIAKAGPLKKMAKVVPYQQVEEGVFIKQVRIKTIKVGYVDY